MSQIILNSIKKVVGLAEDDLSFDLDIMMHTNTALATLTQLGVGPDEGFEIEDATATWEDFLGTDKRYNFVKSYVYLRVRMLFDPPQTSFLKDGIEEQLNEYAVRISILRESDEWVAPISS